MPIAPYHELVKPAAHHRLWFSPVTWTFVMVLVTLSLGCREASTVATAPPSPAPAPPPALVPAPPPVPEPALTPPTDVSNADFSGTIESGKWTLVDAQVTPDQEVAALIQPYKEKLEAVMQEVIGTAEADLVRGRRVSPLANLIVDALIEYARELDAEVDVALMNRGGIRLPSLPKGPITVADIYQLVPFDNRVVLIPLTGSQLETLIRTLAQSGGEPWAGCTYHVTDDRVVSDIQVGGEPLQSDKIYRLATLDYIATVGGEYALLKELEQTLDEDGVFIRDIVVTFVRERETIIPDEEPRVYYAE